MHPIERYRIARGLTQAQLAERMGVNINSVRGWERGAPPRAGRHPRLAEVLGVDAVQLVNEIAQWRQAHPARRRTAGDRGTG